MKNPLATWHTLIENGYKMKRNSLTCSCRVTTTGVAVSGNDLDELGISNYRDDELSKICKSMGVTFVPAHNSDGRFYNATFGQSLITENYVRDTYGITGDYRYCSFGPLWTTFENALKELCENDGIQILLWYSLVEGKNGKKDKKRPIGTRYTGFSSIYVDFRYQAK